VLFSHRDTFQAATEMIVFTKPYLNKDQHAFIEHDEIYLTVTAAKVAIKQF